jgi:hypothetical protein
MTARVLVAYAASTGFNSRQAAVVGSQIAAVGDLEVDVRPIASVRTVEPYVAIYLGWSGHSRAGRRETLRFLTRNATEIPSRRVWVVHHQPTPDGTTAPGPVRLSRLLLRQGVTASAYEPVDPTTVDAPISLPLGAPPTPAAAASVETGRPALV